MDIFQSGVKGETFKIVCVNLGKRSREMSILIECGNVHEIGLDTKADLSAKLGQNVKAAIVHI